MPEYNEDVLNVVCPQCCAAISARCLEHTQLYGKKYRSTPHRERVWKAKGYRWFCVQCLEMVPQEHIITKHNTETQTGSCQKEQQPAEGDAAMGG